MHMWLRIQSETPIQFNQNLGCLFSGFLHSGGLDNLICFLVLVARKIIVFLWSLTAATLRAKPQKRGNSLCWLLAPGFVSSKICLPLMNLQNPQVVAFCSSSSLQLLFMGRPGRCSFSYARSRALVYFIMIYFLLYLPTGPGFQA